MNLNIITMFIMFNVGFKFTLNLTEKKSTEQVCYEHFFKPISATNKPLI